MRGSLLQAAWVSLSWLAGVVLVERVPAADCNRNGREDAEEVAAGVSPDCNRNGFPDECDLDAAGPGFVLGPETAVPGIPIFLAGGDLEGDGDVDLILSSGSNPWDVDRLHRLRNDGTGTLSEDWTLETSGRGNVKLVDLDGGGQLDLILPGRDGGSVVTLPERGDLLVTVDNDPSEPVRHVWCEVADFDGDGDGDLLATTYQPHGLKLFRNEGNVRFVEARFQEFDAAGYQVIAGDWDGDGSLDAAVGSGSEHQVRVLANDGAGGFLPPAAVALNIVPVNMASGDLEADGDLDLFAVSDDTSDVVAILVNDGQGRFAVATHPLGHHARGVHAADLDQNGTLDLLTVNYYDPCGNGSLSFLLQAGGGRLAETETVVIPPTLRSVVPADFDRDGRLDLAVAPLTGAIALVHGEPARHSEDCDGDRVPDECRFAEDDCNWNRRLDACEIRDGEVRDCDADGLPDGCESDCNHNALPDDCDLAADPGLDADHSGIPDECESRTPWPGSDCDGDGIPDGDELAAGSELDCNGNAIPDGCEVEPAWLPRLERLQLSSPAITAVAADLDGDALSDLALSSGGSCCPPAGGELVIYLKTGADGGWREAGAYGLGVWPLLLPPVDIDGDGALDLLVFQHDLICARERAGGLKILYNTGTARFRHGPVLDRGSYVYAGAAGDLDGDGDSDLLFASFRDGGRGRVYVASNLGPAGFAAAGELEVVEPVEVAVSDLDRDGDLDAIATATRSGAAGLALILANDGRGAFHPGDTVEVGSLPRGIAAGDLDGDGFPDLALGRYEQGAPLLLLSRNDGRGSFPVQESLVPPVHPVQIILGDWDGDGDADLLVPGGETRLIGYGSNAVALFLNLGDGRLAQPRLLIAGFFRDVFPLQADGDPELELGFTFLERAHLLDRDLGRFDLAVSTRPVAIAAPDLDGDGLADLLAAGEGVNAGELIAFRGKGDASFEPPVSFGLAGAARSMATADLDGDGDVDAAAAEPFQVEVLRNEGGSLAPASSTRIGSDPVVLTASDLDGDGDLDVATANSFGDSIVGDNVTVLLNDGAGALDGARNYAAGVLVRALVAADLDGDGDTDLAAASEGSRNLSVFAGLGGGSFAFGVEVPLPTAPSLLVAGDLDRDGDADLITLGDDEIYLLRSDGADGFGQPLAVAEPAEEKPYGLALLDADEDADLDLLLASRFALHLHRNQGGTFGGSVETFYWDVWEVGYGGSGDPPPPDRVSIAIADYDGNGTPDPVVALADARRILVFFTGRGAAMDADGDGIPDDCLPAGDHPFRRGDANADGRFDISDPIRTLRHLFLAGEALPCVKAGDADDNGRLEVTDAVRSLNHLFLAGSPLAAPFALCGEDPTLDALDCASHAPCRDAARG